MRIICNGLSQYYGFFIYVQLSVLRATLHVILLLCVRKCHQTQFQTRFSLSRKCCRWIRSDNPVISPKWNYVFWVRQRAMSFKCSFRGLRKLAHILASCFDGLHDLCNDCNDLYGGHMKSSIAFALYRVLSRVVMIRKSETVLKNSSKIEIFFAISMIKKSRPDIHGYNCWKFAHVYFDNLPCLSKLPSAYLSKMLRFIRTWMLLSQIVNGIFLSSIIVFQLMNKWTLQISCGYNIYIMNRNLLLSSGDSTKFLSSSASVKCSDGRMAPTLSTAASLLLLRNCLMQILWHLILRHDVQWNWLLLKFL